MLKKNKKKYNNITPINIILFSVIFFILFCFCNKANAADYYCNSCSDCQDKIGIAQDSDTIYLTKDIINADLNYLPLNDRACFLLDNKQNITINCQDYIIDGIGDNYGIYLRNSSDNNTVKNCCITGFNYGISADESDGIILDEIILKYNGQYGIYFKNSNLNIFNNIIANNTWWNAGIKFDHGDYNILTNITTNNNSNRDYTKGIELQSFNNGSLTNITANNNNSQGIYFYYSDFNNLSNIKTSYNDYGIYFYYYSDNNNIFNSIIKWNTNDDIYIYNTNNTNNIFYNNKFINKNKIYDNGTGTVWDKDGDGNHWEIFDNDDEGCFDADSDGYCDDNESPPSALAYEIDANSIDNHPKYISSITKHYCNSCSDCNAKIADSSSGDTIYLSNNINNASGHCIDLSDKQNLIFDCQEYIIDSNGAGGNGIYLYNNGNGLNTVQNCIISDFVIGLYVVNSNQNTIINNMVKQNTNDITITNSNNNIFYNNKFLEENKITDNVTNSTSWDNGINTGNHWEKYDSEAEGCNDAGGYCSVGYTITSSASVDNYAKYVDQSTCSSCADCNAKIAEANPGDTIILTNSLMDCSGTCIEFNNKNNITFDCNGHTIDGVNSNYGIYIHGSGANENNAVKNCYITEFSYGIYINNSNSNTLNTIIANYNRYSAGSYGIYINNSNSNILTNITANNNNKYGLYFNNSGLNNLTNITANNNDYYGIYFVNSNSSILTEITTNNNNYGIYLSSSNGSNLANVTVNYNNKGIYFINSGNNIVKNSSEIKFNPINIEIISDAGTGNKFYNNDFISKRKIIDNSALTQWDNSADTGNWWEAYDSGDEECTDADSNNICDSYYEINEILGTRDNFPKWKKLNDNEYHCSDCETCSNAITGAKYGDTVILDNHIFGGELICRTAYECSCINFSDYKEGITFNGGDWIIQGPGDSDYGINFYNYCEDNIIKNISINDFSYGIYLYNSQFNILSDINADYNYSGIYFYDNAHSNNLTNITCNNNSNQGIYIRNSDSNILTHANVTNNTDGIYFYNSNNNTVALSTIKSNNTDVEIYSNSSGSFFYSNEFTSKNKINDYSGNTSWDNGLIGNWWEAYDTSDKGCFDNGEDPDPNGVTPVSHPIASDNLCDNHYEIKTGVYDEYPEYKGAESSVWTCSNCAECNNMITQAQYGDTVQLDSNIFTAIDTCIDLSYKQGITFDCQGHIISGNYNNYGVYLIGDKQNDYNTIKNCIITRFEYGIRVEKSYSNIFNNITSNSNKVSGYATGYGFYFFYSNSNILINITAKDNDTAGIYFTGQYGTGSNNNQLSQITASENGTGIYFNSSDNNIITDSSGIKLNSTNIYIGSGSDNNILYNNQFISKEKISDNDSDTHWNKWDSVGGNQEPGNQWEIYDTAEEGCADNDIDGYCDNAPYWNDNFPKYYGITAEYTCSSCANCNEKINGALYGETVKLIQDITGAAEACIKLNYKEGIIFDCNNKKITGISGSDNYYRGITIYGQGAEYNTIKNCSISLFSYGIYIDKSNYNILENITSNNNDCTSSYCYGAGIYINSNYNSLINLAAENNERGIYIADANSNILTYANLIDNNEGLYIVGDSNITSLSTIKSNATDIYVYSSNAQNNKFYKNELISKDKIIDKGTDTSWENGAVDGGNHWEMFDKDEDCYDDGGFLVCCTGGLYCENVYEIDDGSASGDGSASVDNFPKRDPATPQEHECNGCEDCNTKISQAVAGDTVKLTKDIIGSNKTCIDFGSSIGITFNCQDYLISGDNTDYGIYIHGAGDNNIVKNCNISSFNHGIYIYDSASNILTDINVNNNYYGIRSGFSGFNTFNRIIANNNNYGLYIDRENSNIFTDVTANYNSNDGILLYRSNNNSLTNIIVTHNEGTGIYFDGNSSSIFNNIVAINNNYGVYLEGGWYNLSYGGATVNDNTIASSTIKWNTTRDIYIDNPDSSSYDTTVKDNIFYNNKLTNSSAIHDDGYNTHWNKWDSASGDQKPGNHWENFDSDSEGCFDADSNGYCDNTYDNIPIKNYDDHYPKHISSITEHYCNSCSDCNEKIESSTLENTFYLANNISDVDVNGDCLNFSNDKQNLIFDCEGYKLTGNSIGNGIYLNNTNSDGNGSNLIKNCVIENFNVGAKIFDSDNNTINNNTIKSNTTDIQIGSNSDNNAFYNNTFLNENKIADNGINSAFDNGIAGNHWEEYDEPAEGCDDTDPENGYCDAGYTISSSGAVDNFAEYVGTINEFECNSCEDCNTKIANAGAGDTITLISNIVNQAGNCIEFNTKSGITFDCQERAIDGDNKSSGSKGIYWLNSNTDNKIKNCQITGFGYGIYLENSDNNYLENLEANSDNTHGIYFINSDSNILTNIIANNNNYDGIRLANSDSNILTNITANSNKNNTGAGIYIAGSNSNELTNITANSNKNYGIYLESSDNNTATSSEIKLNKINIKINSNSDSNIFYDNEFISKEKIQDEGTNTEWDNGAVGNWWEAYDADNEGCFDSSAPDGLCDDHYEIKTGIFDEFPKYKGSNFNKQDKTCDSCTDCNTKIQNAYYGEKINLIKDISVNGNCIDFGQYKEGVTLNGNDYYIIGSNSGNGIYIHGLGVENNSVENCAVLNFNYGIYLDNSSAVNLKYITANYNDNKAIYISNSNSNILSNITANDNGSGNYGIHFSNSGNNILTDITANNNYYGIYLDGTGENILNSSENNIIKNNSNYGIYIYCRTSGGPSYNIIASSTVKQNTINIEINSSCTLANNITNIFYNNEFISKEKIHDNGETGQIQWDNGVAGNWWEAYDTDDEGCFDNGSPDGLCDDYYEIKTGIFDEFPKYKGALFNQSYNCNGCDDCSNKIQGAYYGETVKLIQDISASGDCIDFGDNKEGITFDCDKGEGNKYVITGDGYSIGVYIHGTGNGYNKIKNCEFNQFSEGIYIDNMHNNYILNIISNNQGGFSDQQGIYLNDSNNNNLQDINVDYNGTGVYLDNSNNNILNNISAQYGSDISSCNSWLWGNGFYFKDNSGNNTITNSTIKYHGNDIFISDSSSQNNKFYNNYFISKEKIQDSASNTKWDNELDTGNWWEACEDAGGGTCLTYIIKTGAQDNYPKYDGGENVITDCINCSDCNEKIIQAKYGETIRLTQDIFNNSGNCIEFKYKQGVIFDGSGCPSGNCIIDGRGSDYGIYICGDGYENNEIKNFDLITSFNYGIYIEESSSNILKNILANNNLIGINLNQSNNNYFIDNIETNNNSGSGAIGILFTQSNSNFLNNITANNNISDFGSGNSICGGFSFRNSDSNTLNNITANNNYHKHSGGGFSFYYSDSNILNNITANNNTLEKDGWYGIYIGGGIYLNSSNNNILTNIDIESNIIQVDGNGGGVSFNSSANNSILYATSTDNNKNGIYFTNSDDNTIASSTIKDNSQYDINIANSTSNRNIFYNNIFNASSNMSDAANDTRWNKWDGANQKPGNWWENYNVGSEGCYDDGTHGGSNPIAYDGYCDNHYEIKTGTYDEYPIRYSVMPADFNITNAYTGSLTGSSTCKNILLWGNNGDADIYAIYRSTNGAPYNNIAFVNSFPYIDDNVNHEDNYSYYIEAKNGIYVKAGICDYGDGYKNYCKENNGTETIQFYPTICSASLIAIASSTIYGPVVDLSWGDKTPTNEYYVLRSIDQEESYQYACSGDGDPPFNNICTTTLSVLDEDANPHPNDTEYYYQDTEATTTINYYKIQSCIGDCTAKCWPSAIGPRNNCYVESNIEDVDLNAELSLPIWKEVGKPMY